MTRKIDLLKVEKNPSYRTLRIAEQIRHIVSQVLLEEEWLPKQDMKISAIVTFVKVSDDLRYATVYVNFTEKEQEQISLMLLNKSKGFFNKKLSQHFQMKASPKVLFKIDRTSEKADRIDHIFSIIKKSNLA